MTAPAGGNAAAVWVSVLPDLGNFGRDLINQLGEAGQRGGEAAGANAERGIAASAKKIAAAGAVAGAALAAGLIGAMNIEKGNDKLAAQLGLTEKESARVGGVAGSLFTNAYGGSLEEVNGAVGAVISTIDGMRTASSATLDAVSRNALDFASTFDIDVQSAVSSVGLLIKSGLASDATEGFDLVTAASQRVPAAMRENILEASDEYGQFFGTLGFSGEQAFAMLVDASAKGEFGIDKVGDAIKEFSIRSTDMSTTSRDAYSAIGLDAETMANKILAGGDTAQGATQEIITGLLSMTNPSEQAAAAIALFGTPLEDLNVTEIPAFLQSMQGASTSMEGWEGAIGRLGATLNDNAATNLESFRRQVSNAFINIVGGQILPIVSTFALFLATSFGPALEAVGGIMTSTVIPALTAFGGFLVENQGPILFIAGMIAAVFVPAMIAMAVQAMVSAIRTAAAWVVTQAAAIRAAAIHSAQIVVMVARWLVLGAMSLLHAGIAAGAWLISSAGAIAAGIVYVVQVAIMVGAWILLGVQSLLAAARVAAAWLIAMGPIGLVIIAVVGLVALIIANWDTVKAVTIAVFTAVGAFLSSVWQGIVAIFNSSVAFIAGLWATFWSGVQGVASAVWGAVSAFIGSVWVGIQTGFQVAVAFLAGLWSTFWTGLQQVASTVFGAIRTVIDTIWAGVRAAFDIAVAFLTDQWTRFWGGLRVIGETVFNAIRVVVDTVWAGIRVVFDIAVAAVMFIWNNFWGGLRTIGEAAFNAIRAVIDTVWAGIRALFDIAVAFLTDQWTRFWGGLRVIGETVFNAIRVVVETVWNGIRGFFETAISLITGIWSAFWSGLSTVASTVFGTIRTTIDTVIAGIVTAFRTVVSTVGTIWAGIKRLLASPVNFLINTVYNNGIVRAWNFVAGLIPGIGPINTIPGIPEFARGGPVMSDTVLRAGEAGPEYILSAPAVAGLGGIDAVDQMHRQAVHNPISLRELNTGRYVEGADHEGPGISTSGFGGVKPHVARAGHYLKQRFGIGSVGGVGARSGPSDHPRGLALDFMTYNDTAKGDALVNYLQGQAAHFAVKYIIWKQRINKGGGWTQMEDRGSVTANHFDHPHVSFLDGPGGGGDFSGDGAAWFNPLPGLIRGFFDTFVNPLVNDIPGGPPKFLDVPKGLAGKVRDQVLDWALGMAGGGGADPMDQGGVAFGKGLMMKDVIDPERVLSPRQTVAFERLVDSLTTAPTASMPGAPVPVEFKAGGMLDRKLTELIDAVRAQPRHGPMTIQTTEDPVVVARAVQLALRP